MEIVIGVIVLVVGLGVIGATMGRREAKAVEDEFSAVAPGVQIERQFERPRHENELF